MTDGPFDRNRRILLPTLRGVIRAGVARPGELRRHVVPELWAVAKRFGAGSVIDVDFGEIPCLWDAVVDGYLQDQHRLILAALARGLRSRTFFEIGTNRGRTTWTVAHNNPELELYTLDVPPGATPDRTALELSPEDAYFFRDESLGEAFQGTPEAERITQLFGDSAMFDYSRFEESIDLVYVDGAHTYEYVSSDSANALRILSPTGTIVWDDYTISPGVYQHVVELSATLDRPVYHLRGTRMAIYSRQSLVRRELR
jgi:predicted O-methyltransferase YrrM